MLFQNKYREFILKIPVCVCVHVYMRVRACVCVLAN